MSVHKRKLPSGAVSYQVRWRENGHVKSRHVDDRKTAVELDKQIRLMRQAGDLAVEMEKRRVTIRDLYGAWLERSMPTLAQKTAEHYGLMLDLRILPQLGSRRAAQLTVADVEQWIGWMRDRGDGNPTIVKAVAVLSALLSMAVRDGIIAVNVAQQARKPRQVRMRVPYLIKPTEVELIRVQWERAGRERDVVLLDLLAYAGLRPESEAITLTWRNVRDRSLVIRDSKRQRERSIAMLDPLARSLKAWHLRSGRPTGDQLVVPTNSGNPWTESDWRNWHRRVFKPAAVAAGLPADVRSRDLRGSFVSLLVHEGRSIIEVARQLGHGPEVCLRDYAQVFDETAPEDRRPAASVIAEARNAAEMFAYSSHAPANTAAREA